MARKRKWAMVLCCLCLFFAGGCWDAKNIEDRGFIIGSAIDLGDKEKTAHGNYVLSLTNQLVVPEGYNTSQQESSSGSGSSQKAYKNITGTGSSVFEIADHMDTQTSKEPYFEHIKVLLVSEDVVKYKQLFASVTDIFVRDPDMRRGIKVVVTKGRAKNYLDINGNEGEQLPALYINQIMENTLESKQTLQPVRLGKVHQFLLGSTSFALPYASMTKNSIDISGAAVFHGFNNTYVGDLNPNETKGLNLIKENAQGGGMEFTISGRLMSFEFKNSNSKVRVDTSNPDKMNMDVELDVEGRIDEMYGDKQLLNESYIAAMEKHVQRKIKELVEHTINKGQKELNADIFGFGTYLKNHDYKKWKKEIQPNWEQGKKLFANGRVNVSVKATLRTFGSTDRTKIRHD